VSPLCDARLARPRRRAAWSVSSVYTQTWRRAHGAVSRRGLIYSIPTRARDDIAGQTRPPNSCPPSSTPTSGRASRRSLGSSADPPLQPSSVAGRHGRSQGYGALNACPPSSTRSFREILRSTIRACQFCPRSRRSRFTLSDAARDPTGAGRFAGVGELFCPRMGMGLGVR
jgi:hypothetical protein